MRYPTLAALLAEHGLSGAAEEPLSNEGYSGSALSRLRARNGASFVLKRMSMERDWIMRATDDEQCREAAFAHAPFLGAGVITPAIEASKDGSEYALLMHDIRDDLLGSDLISETQLNAIIMRMAELHAIEPPSGMPWCDPGRRLTLLTTDTVHRAGAGSSLRKDVDRGWTLFDQHASPRTVRGIRGLFENPTPLLRALDAMPAAFLHGDLKLDNIGLDGDGRMWLIDWAMTLVAPPAVELGWFLAVNSRRLPVPLDEVMSMYARAASVPPSVRARHDALTVACGLVLRGWRKALDAEAGEPIELRWWCERFEDALPYLDGS